MKSAYQLSPIPPFRAQITKSTSSLFSTSSNSQATASPESIEATYASSQLTSFSFNKKRPPPLKHSSGSNLSSIVYDGLSAPLTTSPLGTEQIHNDQNGISPRSGCTPLSPLTKGHQEPRCAPIQSRFQPGRPNNYVPGVSRANMSASKPRTSNHGSILIPKTDETLTPPATPNSREANFLQAKSISFLSKAIAPQLPPTPSTSPYHKATPLLPTTVSAKALTGHKLHPVFLANYTLGDELGSGGFGFVVQASRNEDSMQCAVKFIYKEKIPQQAWVKDDHWDDDSDTNGIMRTKDGIKRVPLEAVSIISSPYHRAHSHTHIRIYT